MSQELPAHLLTPPIKWPICDVNMEEKLLLFEPSAKGYFNKSPYYAVPMFAKTMALCSKYLVNALKNPIDIKTTDEYLNVFWRIHFESSRTRLYVTGRNYLAPGETYIFMSNHESWMDIPAIFGAVPTSLRMVAKTEIMQVPILGHAMANAGFIAIDRKNRSKAIKQLEVAKKRLREGVSIWIAPEGTRTRDGTIGVFKKGGFYLAKELKTSIVPVFIEGAAAVMPADSLVVRPNQSITVHFAKPVLADQFDHLTTQELMNKIRLAIIEKQSECSKTRGNP